MPAPGLDSDEPDRETPEWLERQAIARQAIERNAVVLSGPFAQPLFVWSKRPLSGPEIKTAVEAAGNSPFEVLAGWPLVERMIKEIPEKPLGFSHGWLVVVRNQPGITTLQRQGRV